MSVDVAVDETTHMLAALEPRLRRAFVARYGWPDGVDVAADVMEWVWEHRDRLAAMDNPAGYLWRVGTSRFRRLRRWRREQAALPADLAGREPSGWFEPRLPAALNRLDHDSRTAVVLVHCFDWSYAEVAALLDVPLHTVRNRIHRGMEILRRELGVDHG